MVELNQQPYGQNTTCPRCLGPIPDAEHAGMGGGAGSRMTRNRNIEICSPCGEDEAMGRGRVPISDWPIVTDTTPVKLPGATTVWDGATRAQAATNE